MNPLIGGGGDWISWLAFMAMWVGFLFFYPKLMLMQIMWKLEKVSEELDLMSTRAKKFLINKVDKKPSKTTVKSINRFFEFFVINPVDLDPNGIIAKLDHMITAQKDRFAYFVDQVMPKAGNERKANAMMGFSAGIELYMLSKILKHYIKLIKETNSYQLAIILQMQLPLIEKLAVSMAKGTKALAEGQPIGDAIGPYAAAKLIGKFKTKEIEEETLLAETTLNGRKLLVIKAKGPGGRLGRPGKAVEKLVEKNKIARIITIDAAGKLEGEKTGSVAEGVGVAMGGPGVEKSYIEAVAVKNKIPLDSIIVKMKPEEAILPMRKAVKDAIPEVMESVKRSISRTKKGDKIIVVGVGNTAGVGNDAKALAEVDKWVEKYERKLKQKKKTTIDEEFFAS
ncbi:MAG: DUF1512 domain-containing protein [Candidatus Micrarchaeota archaeon]|nr:DUF1512 domain-containing protein [Candidatus Micrarchaeota archaeon]